MAGRTRKRIKEELVINFKWVIFNECSEKYFDKKSGLYYVIFVSALISTRKVSDRGGKMYIYFLQNFPQATVAGPYSILPKAGAPDSMPLDWIEVKKGLSVLDFNLSNAIARVKKQGDIFTGVMGKGT